MNGRKRASAARAEGQGSMTPCAWYNEVDPYAAQWLRNLIAAGLIAPGVVDERSIADVQPEDLDGFTQCHFFAGIGGWSYALRLASWPDDRPVWTGSCPCQSLSVAGPRTGHLDERHLWPTFHRLIDKRRPATVFGEQTASKDGLEWLAGVRLDLESSGYACGAANLPAAGVGAPHIRSRLYWVAYADGGHAGAEGLQRGGEHGQFAQDGCAAVGVADANIIPGRKRNPHPRRGHQRGDAEQGTGPCCGGVSSRMGNTDGQGLEIGGSIGGVRCEALGTFAGPAALCASDAGGLADAGHEQARRSASAREAESGRPFGDASGCGASGWTGDTTSEQARLARQPWRRSATVDCADGNVRRFEPGSFPLLARLPKSVGRGRAYLEALAALPRAEQGNRQGRIRGYGNAICAPLAAEFIAACEG